MLGQIYAKHGNKDKAMEYYRQPAPARGHNPSTSGLRGSIVGSRTWCLLQFSRQRLKSAVSVTDNPAS